MMSRRNILTCCLLALLLSVTPVLAQTGAEAPDADLLVGLPTQPDPGLQTTLDSMFYEHAIFDLDTVAIERQVRTGRLALHLGNRTFDLKVELNDLRAPGYRAVVLGADGSEVEVDAGPVTTFRGVVAGDPDSIVRLNVLPDRFQGYVKSAEEWVYIDSLADYAPGVAPDRVVVYRATDVRPGSSGACGTGKLHQLAHELRAERNPVTPSASSPADKAANTLQVATECDGQYWADYGNPGVFNRITGILNDVDGIYESEIDTSISITYQQCWSSISGDPYTSLDASTTLNQFRSWWNANRGGTTRDTAHQFSGKEFNGSTIGIAWVGVICNAPSYAYGVSQDLSSSAQRRRLTAHEIGHNLSAGHDNQSPVCSGVSCNGNGPLMCSFVQTGSSSAADDFSNCSLDDIDDHIDSFGSCL